LTLTPLPLSIPSLLMLKVRNEDGSSEKTAAFSADHGIIKVLQLPAPPDRPLDGNGVCYGTVNRDS